MRYATKLIFGILCIFALVLSGCKENPTDARVNELLEKTKSSVESFPCEEHPISVDMFYVKDFYMEDEIVLLMKKNDKLFAITDAFLPKEKSEWQVKYFFYTKNRWEEVTQNLQADFIQTMLAEKEKDALSTCTAAHMLKWFLSKGVYPKE